eukprot:5264901-Pyramimonas_sp.AAC.1
MAETESPMNVDAEFVCSDSAVSDPPAGAPGGAGFSSSGAGHGAPSGNVSSGHPNPGAAGGWGPRSNDRPGGGNDGQNFDDPNEGGGR